MLRKRLRRSRRRAARQSLDLAARTWTGPDAYTGQLPDDPNSEVNAHGPCPDAPDLPQRR